MKRLGISLTALSVTLATSALAFGPLSSGASKPAFQTAQAQSQGQLFGQGRGRTGERGSGDPAFMAGWDANEDGMLSLTEAQERRGELFEALDDDADGTLNTTDFKAFLDDMTQSDEEPGNNRRALGGMTLDFNDVNGDGAVTRDEFVAQTAAFLKGMDRDGDGTITNKDFGPRSDGLRNKGQGRGKGMGNGRGSGKGMGHGMGKGREGGQGRGNGQGRGWQQQDG